MKKYGKTSLPTWSLFILWSLSITGYTQNKQLTFNQAYLEQGEQLTGPLPDITGWYDKNHYLEYKAGVWEPNLYKVNVKNGNPELFIDYNKFKNKLPQSFSFQHSEDHTTDLKKFIFNEDEDLFFFSLLSGELKQLTYDEAEEKNARFSPDGTKVAYTKGHNLYVAEVNTGKELQLTFDGSNVVYNGWASWVYYEEILGRSSNHAAFWWSPDSKMIAFLRFDDSPVPEFPIFHTEGVHGKLEITHYPKAGDPTPLVRLGIAQLETGKITWADTRENEDRYIAWPYWSVDSKRLYYQDLNRDQDELIIYSTNPLTGEKKEIYKEKQDTWVDFFKDIYFFQDESGLLLRSNRSGWFSLYYYDLDGKLISTVSENDWRITEISYVDEKNKTVYFTGTGGISTERHLFKVGLDGENQVKITSLSGTHKVSVSPGGRYFYDAHSTLWEPEKITLYSTEGKPIRELGNSKNKEMDDYQLAKTELFTIPSTENFELPAVWYLPPNFDDSKQYPVIISIYGGPDAGRVNNSFPRRWYNHYLAQHGMIVLVVDHRGSGHFGKTGMNYMHRNLGKWEMHDYIEAVKWLYQKPFIDKAKIGITGGSYGGYLTCLALTYGSGYFTHGVSNYPVTDWKLYDNVYTERYMDTPEQNPEGYTQGSVFTYAEKYKGKLLITHGTIDDNVHMQNLIQLVDLFQDMNKDFEMMVYPGERHGWRGLKREHSSREAVQFWFQHFLNKPFDPEND